MSGAKPGPPFVTEQHAPVAELYREGFTHKQIARKLGRTPSGIRSTIRRLRDRDALPPRYRVEWPVPRP